MDFFSRGLFFIGAPCIHLPQNNFYAHQHGSGQAVCMAPGDSDDVETRYLLCPRPLRQGGLNDDARLTSVCLSRTSGLSREQRSHRKTKIGTAVACTSHVTRTPRSRSKGQRSTCRGRAYCGGLPHSLLVTQVDLLYSSNLFTNAHDRGTVYIGLRMDQRQFVSANEGNLGQRNRKLSKSGRMYDDACANTYHGPSAQSLAPRDNHRSQITDITLSTLLSGPAMHAASQGTREEAKNRKQKRPWTAQYQAA